MDAFQGGEDRRLPRVVVGHAVDLLGTVALGKAGHLRTVVVHLENQMIPTRIVREVRYDVADTLRYRIHAAFYHSYRRFLPITHFLSKQHTLLSFDRLILERINSIQSLRNPPLHHSIELFFT